MNIDTIWEGIIIGGTGGSIAGLSILIISILRENGVGTPNNPVWKSTEEIASFNNLTVERVNYICSIHKKITRRIKIDLWPNEHSL